VPGSDGLYWVTRLVVRLALWMLTDCRVSGREHVPSTGAFLLVTNHLSMLDPPVFMVAAPRKCHVLVARRYCRGPVGLLMRRMPAIFVRRGQPDRSALAAALVVLRRGEALGIAPEGTRSRVGTLQRARPGAGFLARHAGVPIVPAAITGTETALRMLVRLQRPSIRVLFGPSFTLSSSESHPNANRDAADEMLRQVARLLPQRYRGAYAESVGVVEPLGASALTGLTPSLNR
jgi:1-acyl-sn-glycerol-3-phosphate acyltransferase